MFLFLQGGKTNEETGNDIEQELEGDTVSPCRVEAL